jgi:ketosteroid isomerase-like protein
LRTELKVGCIYHWLGYEDDELSRPMVTSMEYLGLDILKTEPPPDASRHFFRMLGSEEKVMFAQNNLPELVDVPGLIEQLRNFEAGKHKRPPEASVATLKAIAAAFNAHDLDAIMEFFADDCSLDMPRGPDPWGKRFTGKAAVREGLAARFKGLPDVHYGDDRHWVSGNMGVSEWLLTGTMLDGTRLRVRGCDHWEFRDGRIIRKDSYWKIVQPVGR